MINAGSYMSSPVLTTSPDAFAYDAVQEMNQKNVGAFLVKSNGEYVGIFTKTDWTHKFLKGGDPNSIVVSAMMVSPIISVEMDEPISKVSELMEENNIRHIAVTDKGEIKGILSVKDLQKCWVDLK
jgi:CBS domain-containing protein